MRTSTQQHKASTQQLSIHELLRGTTWDSVTIRSIESNFIPDAEPTFKPHVPLHIVVADGTTIECSPLPQEAEHAMMKSRASDIRMYKLSQRTGALWQVKVRNGWRRV